MTQFEELKAKYKKGREWFSGYDTPDANKFVASIDRSLKNLYDLQAAEMNPQLLAIGRERFYS